MLYTCAHRVTVMGDEDAFMKPQIQQEFHIDPEEQMSVYNKSVVLK